jgi:EAL and modified HD-GYP domain-containing signal transduction protein
MSEVLLHRTPVVTRSQELAGYELQLRSRHGESAAAGGLSALLAGQSADTDFFQRLPDRFALADCEQVEALKPAAPPGQFVLGLRADGTADLDALCRKCKSAGFGVCVLDPQNSAWTDALLSQAGYLRLSPAQLNGTLAKYSHLLRRHGAKQIAADLRTRADFDAAHKAGCDLFSGYFFLEAQGAEAQTINPSYNTIIGLMKLAQDNAPIGKIDDLLKRDAALSYKLLRYINSAGFGLSCEIQSFRHAVTMLGYQNLHRWLALLLVTAGKQTGSAALVGAAIVRGRLAELLAQGLFDAKERDNLFIVGAFSLLHVILCMPLEEVTETITLPEAITDALSARQGPYGPILQLVELLEQLSQPGAASKASDLAMSLGLPLDAVNRAQLDALAWSESLGQ